MGEIRFVDTTVRDGNQSLWGATGLTAGMILSAASDMDRVGFKAIDFNSSIHMGVSVRYHKENPWEKIKLAAKMIKNTPLSFGTTGRRFLGFKRVPDSVMFLVMERVAANGIRRVWIVDANHDVDLIIKVARMAKRVGIEEYVAALSFTISPVHTDEYYARKARELARCEDIDTLYIKDQGGLLTPERVRTLVPAIKEAIGEKPLEIHSHCSTGLAPICYLEAIRLGVDVVHTAVPPLAQGTSLPAVENILENLPYLNHGANMDKVALKTMPSWLWGKDKYWSNLDRKSLAAMSAHFQQVSQREGLSQGQPVEHDANYYVHQVPGGMMTTLQRQLSEMKKEDLLHDVLEEIVKVRQDLGYPIMVTPFSQFVGTQATMNVLSGERYKLIPVEIIQYAAEWFGSPTAPIDPNVLDKIASQPEAKDIFNKELPQPSIKELRQEMGLGSGISDEEFLLRYVMMNKEVDNMLAAGPVNITYP
jgi:oxaloacetate decarboxylase alpha subunit